MSKAAERIVRTCGQDAGVVVGEYDAGQEACSNLHTVQARGSEPHDMTGKT
jgi:hypothetical protein